MWQTGVCFTSASMNSMINHPGLFLCSSEGFHKAQGTDVSKRLVDLTECHTKIGQNLFSFIPESRTENNCFKIQEGIFYLNFRG